MDWLNLHTSVLDSAAFIGSTPVERATWLCLLRYCIGQENAGRIEDASQWSNRKWQQLCRCTRKEILAETELWLWESGCLVVSFYPLEKQVEVQRNRQNGRLGGRPFKNQVPPQVVNQVGNPEKTEWFDSAETEQEGNRKGKEGNGRELEEKDKGKNQVVIQKADTDARTAEPPEKTPVQLRAERLFHRRPTTPWAKAELTAWRASRPAIEATNEDEWKLLEWFYAEPQAKTYARKDLATLLNNWTGEIDRARAYHTGNGGNLSPRFQNAF